MQVDPHAPLFAKKEILVDAPLEIVWKLQTNINAWPTWQKDVSEAKLKGDLKAGTIFEWKALGMNIVSTLQEVNDHKSIGWSGDSFGMHAKHLWSFYDMDNKTKVITEESLSGWFPTLIKIFQGDFLDKSLSKSLQTLKDEAEKIK